MMISPESYYEMNLKGRNADEIKSTIRGLKISMGMLKRTMEHPDYPSGVICCPSDAVILSCGRDYLKRAKDALVEAGGVYEPSKAELTAEDFDENIPNIKRVAFSIGGFFGGYEEHTITLDEDTLYRNVDHSLNLKPSNFFIPPNDPMTKDDFLFAISQLHIGEWRRYYDTRRFGFDILDGTQWDVEIEYNNGHKPFKSGGSNAYPYNFRQFKELFGIDEEPEEDEDE